MASLDVAKAFDSVTHPTLKQTMTIRGFPQLMIDYVMSSYKNSTTRFSFDGRLSDIVRPTCGVKQGDHLSLILFNLVMDRMIRGLSPDIGVNVGGNKFNGLLFADDLLLFASTPKGLQLSLDHVHSYLKNCGLLINNNKSFTLSIKAFAKQKKTAVTTSGAFMCGRHKLPSISRQDTFSYLGIPFTPEGKSFSRPNLQFSKAISKITKAPLKPSLLLGLSSCLVFTIC